MPPTAALEHGVRVLKAGPDVVERELGIGAEKTITVEAGAPERMAKAALATALRSRRECDVPELLDELLEERRKAHQRLLASVADLTDEQLRWRPGPHAPAIGFHLFHVARWADYDREIVGGGAQTWIEQGLAARWGLEAATLGETGTGMGMGDEASERLVLPSKEDLTWYAEGAFTGFDAFARSLTPGDLSQMTRPPDSVRRSVQTALFTHLAHDNRHLGMIEALRGLLGLQGTATI
jgi:hypothetical protein